MSDIDVNVILENLTELLTNTVNMTSVFYDLFINPEPMDVTLTQFNNNGKPVTITVPNRAKDMKRARMGIGSPEGVVEASPGILYIDESDQSVYIKTSGSGNTGWTPISVAASITTIIGNYLQDNGYLDEEALETYLQGHTYTTESDVINIIGRSRSVTPMETLETSGIVKLTDGYTYKITPTDDVTFSLPVVSDLTKLHRIFVQLNLTNPDFEINTGVSYFFNKINPDFSKAGAYDIQYEYDNALNTWVCGTALKGEGAYGSLPDLYEKVDGLVGLDVDSDLSTTSTNPVQNRVVTSALNTKANSVDLSQVAFSGEYEDILNKPVIPTKTSQLENNSGFISNLNSSDIVNILGYTPYNGATNPNGYQANVIETIRVNRTAQTVSRKTVDLNIGNGILYLRRNGSLLGEFSANQLDLTHIDITVPTRASEVHALPETTQVGSGQIVIERNGHRVGAFMLDQISNSTINISVPTQASDIHALPDTEVIGKGRTYLLRNGNNLGLIEANQTFNNTIDITVPTQASDVHALPDSTVIGDGKLVIQQNDRRLGTFTANATSNELILISVPTTASDVGALPASTVIGNADLVIEKNGVAVGTFKANETDDSTINISVPTTASDVGALPDDTVIGNADIVIQRNSTAVGTINANQTATSTINISIPTTASEVGALPDDTVIGNADIVIQRNSTAVGTINANQTDSATIDISVPTSASEVGALPDDTVIGNADIVIKRNGATVGTINANQTDSATIDISVPTSASEVGALPDSTVIGIADLVIKRNNSAIGTFNANATTSKTIDISVPTSASDIGITVGEGNLVVKSNNVAIGTFNANATTAKTIDISVPTSASDIGALPDNTFIPSVDQSYSSDSTNAQSGTAVAGAIADALVGGVRYQGTWDATNQTDYSGITLPVQKGYLYFVTGSATIGGITWNDGDFLLVNENVSVGGTLTDVSKMNSTESPDLVKLNSVQTLTNKTIDADDNTIKDLGTSNFKSGVLQTIVRAESSASDTSLPSEKAVSKAIKDFITASSSDILTNKTIDADDNTIKDISTTNFKSGVLQTSIRSSSQTSDLAILSEKAAVNALSEKYDASNPSGYQENVIETIKVNGTAQTATSKTVNLTIGVSDLIIKRNGTTLGTFNANATSDSTIDISVPTTASDVGALPNSTIIGIANLVIKRNNTAIGTFNANATTAKTIDISVPTSASDVGALPSSTVIGNADLVIQKNGAALGTFNANGTISNTINISIPTTASDIGALPSSTVIGNANMVIQRNGTAVGTFTANATAASTVNISVPTTAADIGLTIDSSLSTSSTNPVQNKAITNAIGSLKITATYNTATESLTLGIS